MVQDIIWKADINSACQQISCFLYRTRRLITVFTKVHHWTLSWASRIQYVPSIPISLRSSLMLSSHLRLGLPNQNSVNTSPLPHACHMSRLSHLPWFNHPNNIRWRRSSLCSFLHKPSTSLLGPNILNTLFSKTLSPCSSLKERDQVSHLYSTTGKITVFYILTMNQSKSEALWNISQQ
jgi:hypothetical protein